MALLEVHGDVRTFARVHRGRADHVRGWGDCSSTVAQRNCALLKEGVSTVSSQSLHAVLVLWEALLTRKFNIFVNTSLNSIRRCSWVGIGSQIHAAGSSDTARQAATARLGRPALNCTSQGLPALCRFQGSQRHVAEHLLHHLMEGFREDAK